MSNEKEMQCKFYIFDLDPMTELYANISTGLLAVANYYSVC